MAVLKLPSGGLSLSYDTKPGNAATKESAQVIRMDLLEMETRDILRSFRNNEQVRLRFGKKPSLQLGQKSLHLGSNADTFPSELFSRSTESGSPLYFSGRLSHTLEVQRAQEATAETDEALAALQNTLKSMQEQKASNETSFVRSKDDARHTAKRERPSPLLGQPSSVRRDLLGAGGPARSTPSSPFLSASYSPRQGPTSVPLLGGSHLSVKDKVRLEAIKIPLIHLLAIQPRTSNSLAEKLHAPVDDCEKVLEKVARDWKEGGGKKELKEKTYRDLDVWKFPYKNQEDRQAAIEHAIHAFDRMRVEKADPLWQSLLPVEERGKGKILSRLNFNKPLPSQPTPRTSEESESKEEASDREAGKGNVKKQSPIKRGAEEAAVKKKAADKTSSIKVRPGSEVAGQSKTRGTSQGRVPKQEGKFKSSERIVDSDEEGSAADVVVAKPSTTAKRKQQSSDSPANSPRRPASPLPKKQFHKSNLSSASLASDNGDQAREASNKSSQTLKPLAKAENGPSKLSPRPRHDSSPQKPSPLGSSPPTNSTDADNSTSSKASSQSSAPSSPPSSTDMPIQKSGNKYSPVIAEKRTKIEVANSPAKRKAEKTLDQPPAKRQQVTKPPSSMTPNGLFSEAKRPDLERKVSESERSSSPEKPGPSREDIIENTKRFQRYYTKYKDLYDKISQTPEKDRDDKEMKDLWKMQKRLEEMKAEIWDNWPKVEKEMKTEAG